MPEPSAGLLRLVRAIDWFTDSTGIWIAALSLPLVGAVIWEVTARYAFGAPTIWSFDVTYSMPRQRSPPGSGPSCLSMSGMHRSSTLMLH